MVIDYQAVTYELDGQLLGPFTFSALSNRHLVITGSSGVGKSTLLRSIPGFITPSTGKIYVDTIPVESSHLHRIRPLISFLPQNPLPEKGQFSWLVKRIAGFQMNRHLPSPGAVVPDYMQRMGLEENLWDKEIENMSGGQKQRAALSIMFWLERPILLMDEPTSALDALSTRKVVDLLKSLKKTIISVSHDTLWMENSDDVIEIE